MYSLFDIPYFVRKMIVNKECIKSNKGEHYQIKINLSKHEIQYWLFFNGEIIIGVYQTRSFRYFFQKYRNYTVLVA